MDHLDILKEGTRTISSPARFVREQYVSDRGGCSVGHLVVAYNGGVTGLKGDRSPSKLAKSAPEVAAAVEYVAKAICKVKGVKFYTSAIDADYSVGIVTSFNDNPMNTHAQIVYVFRAAQVMALADMQVQAEAEVPKETPKPTLDYTEVNDLLADAAVQESARELIAA